VGREHGSGQAVQQGRVDGRVPVVRLSRGRRGGSADVDGWGSSSDMVDVLDGDVDHGCRYSNFKVDGCTQPIPQQAGEGRDGRVRGDADSQIDGDLSGRHKRLRLARLLTTRFGAARDRHASTNDRIQLAQRLLDQLQPPQHRLGQLGMVGVEASSQPWARSEILCRIRPLARPNQLNRVGLAVDMADGLGRRCSSRYERLNRLGSPSEAVEALFGDEPETGSGDCKDVM
jgi:hypothetical protein